MEREHRSPRLSERVNASGTDGPSWLTNCWHLFGLLLWTLLLRVLNRVTVVGREHIPPRGARNILICSNHISALDPFIIGITAMPRFSPVWWRAAAKEELFERPIVNKIIATWGAFPVKRGQKDLASIARMVALLPSSVLVIFPEGTWSETGQLLRGKPGVGKVIYDARPTVIPVAIAGTDEILPREHTMIRVGRRATIAFGPPVDLTRFYAEPDTIEQSQRIIDTVIEKIDELYRAIKHQP